MTLDADVEACIARERELLTSACRADPARAGQLLADDYVEFGASGRVWDRHGMLAALAADAAVAQAAAITDDDLTGRVLANGLVLLTYRSATSGRSALRSSLWRREAGEWRVFFHQGTVIPEPL